MSGLMNMPMNLFFRSPSSKFSSISMISLMSRIVPLRSHSTTISTPWTHEFAIKLAASPLGKQTTQHELPILVVILREFNQFYSDQELNY